MSDAAPAGNTCNLARQARRAIQTSLASMQLGCVQFRNEDNAPQLEKAMKHDDGNLREIDE
eukprot:scaffold75274_cov15-Prasinocladus_malaysianus.AAC.1